MRPSLIPKLTVPGGDEPLRLATVARERDGEIIAGAAHAGARGLLPIREGILDCLAGGSGSLSPAQLSNRLPPVAWGYEWPWRRHSLSLLSGARLGFERERDILFEMLGEPRGALWLDLAASTALYARWLAPRLPEADIVALDLAWPMLREGQRRARREGTGNIGFVRGRGERLPFGAATLDGVLCGGSLNEFGAAAPRVLREVARTLRPGAPALFMYLRRAATPSGRRAQRVAEGGGIAFWDESEAHALFASAGLALAEERAHRIVAFARLERGT